jgi:hypothetical protein
MANLNSKKREKSSFYKEKSLLGLTSEIGKKQKRNKNKPVFH